MDTDLTAWLGPAADDLTDEQRAAFDDAARAYFALPLHTERDPADDLANSAEDDDALSAILQDILGEGSLMEATRVLWAAQHAHTGWIRAMAARGMSEVQIAEQSGITRVTVRKRLGK